MLSICAIRRRLVVVGKRIRGANVVQTVKRERVKIDGDIINEALDAADAGLPGRDIWRDTEQRSLILERRGKAVVWFVKTRSFTRMIGRAGRGYKGDHVNPRAAREAAARILVEISARPPRSPESDTVSGPAAQPICWTWAEMVTARMANLSGPRMVGERIKAPSKDTQDDVRRSFGVGRDGAFDPDKRPSLAPLQTLRLDAIDAAKLGAAVRGIEHRRARAKFLAYAKSALTWSLSNTHRSGLNGSAWWNDVRPPDLEPEEIATLSASRSKLARRKASFGVEHVGEMLARHEAFCSDRKGRDKVSPGVRCGLWWTALTAARRGSTTRLQRAGIEWSDARNEAPGWGTALWTEDAMKARQGYMLPVPPIGLRILWISMADWSAAVTGAWTAPSQWVFASTQRQPREISDRVGMVDIPTNPYSLANHLARMRGKRGGEAGGTDHLAGIPEFSLHTIRAAAARYLDEGTGLPAAASSALLGHAGEYDVHDPEAAARTTEKFYNASQKMPLKTRAMAAWTNAVMAAFEKAGGRLPEPVGKVPPMVKLPPRPW